MLRQNISNLYGAQGNSWITSLPDILLALKNYWGLSEITPVDNMTFNYVAKAILASAEPVVLKISYDKESISNERAILEFFDAQACIKIIDYHEEFNALLLQQAIPGTTLKAFYPKHPDYVMDCYIRTMKKLHHQSLAKQLNAPSIADWLKALESPNLQQIPADLLIKAITLRDQLLTSLKDPILLHGDLHHDNVLKHQNTWLAIDPKGVIGEAEFEIAAFDFLYVNELSYSTQMADLLHQRILLLAQKSGLNAQRIKDWVFVRLILMAVWCTQDQSDPNRAIQLAKQCFVA